jgi:Four helix bundle sensory module for signal transduction
MNVLLNLTTRTRLFFGFGLILLLLLAVLATAYRGVAAMQTSQEILYNRDFADAVNLMEFRDRINAMPASLLNMMLLSLRSEQEKWHNDIKTTRFRY